MASPAAALTPPSPSAIMLSEAFFSLQLHEIIGVRRGGGGDQKGGGVLLFIFLPRKRIPSKALSFLFWVRTRPLMWFFCLSDVFLDLDSF